jgi:hypothetical protein
MVYTYGIHNCLRELNNREKSEKRQISRLMTGVFLTGGYLEPSRGGIDDPAITWVSDDVCTLKRWWKGYLVKEKRVGWGIDGGSVEYRFPSSCAGSAEELSRKFKLELNGWSSSNPGGYFQGDADVELIGNEWVYTLSFGYDC